MHEVTLPLEGCGLLSHPILTALSSLSHSSSYRNLLWHQVIFLTSWYELVYTFCKISLEDLTNYLLEINTVHYLFIEND